MNETLESSLRRNLVLYVCALNPPTSTNSRSIDSPRDSSSTPTVSACAREARPTTARLQARSATTRRVLGERWVDAQRQAPVAARLSL